MNIKENDLFDEYYDKHNLDKNSSYSSLSKKHLVIEAEYLNSSLCSILNYIEQGGTDLDVIRAEVIDGIYESRI